MHNIQRKILIKMLYAESLNYAQVRPEGVESNHFAYHLEQLIKAGLIAKGERRYALTPQGMAYADRMSQKKMVERVQAHIATLIHVVNDEGRTLLFKRTFQPYIHRLGLPQGKTHLGETVDTAAERELFEKTGLTGIPLTHRGIMYIETKIDGFIVSNALCHVFHGKTKGTPATTSTYRGECLWEDDTVYKEYELMPGYRKTKELLRDNPRKLFFAEFSEELPMPPASQEA